MASRSGASSSSEAVSRLELMHILENLKTQKRTGWVREGVKDPESIADHMYRMAMLALMSEDTSLDVSRCVLLAIVHDLAEATVGDITPFDNISRSEKQRRELAAIDHFTKTLLFEGTEASKRIRSLWLEYEEGSSREAKFVKDLDRIELALQGVEYERRDRIRTLQPFFRSSVEKIAHPEVREWANTLMDERLTLHGSQPFADDFGDVRPTSQDLSPSSDVGRTKADDVGLAGSKAALALLN